MELIERFRVVANFLEQNPIIIKKLNENFEGKLTDSDVLYNISQNKRLFLLYSRTECKKFINIIEAFDNTSPNDIIIYFAELGLYGVFADINNYYLFCNKINEMRDDGDEIDVSIHQLVLAEQKQKLVFVSNGDSIDKIRKYVKDYFRADISTNIIDEKMEITVLEPIAENNNSARELYDNLYNYIYKKDKTVASEINPMQLLREREYKYTNPIVNDCIGAKSLDELVKILKSVSNANVTINFNAPVAIGNGNTINQTVKKDKYSETKKWIKENLPEDREITTIYYKRYCDNFHGKKLPNNMFGKLVRDQGFQIVQNTNGRQWTV
ncbi:hypothetical protein PV-S19_0237 [Pacmanvirus S19]|nr:hypothetical protein PV-S19_0237 [Pacmanvirus S19]